MNTTDVHRHLENLSTFFVLVRIPSGKYKQTEIIIIKSKIRGAFFRLHLGEFLHDVCHGPRVFQ